jgi:hypothetical protein
MGIALFLLVIGLIVFLWSLPLLRLSETPSPRGVLFISAIHYSTAILLTVIWLGYRLGGGGDVPLLSTLVDILWLPLSLRVPSNRVLLVVSSVLTSLGWGLCLCNLLSYMKRRKAAQPGAAAHAAIQRPHS